MVYPRFILRRNPKQRVIAILMVTHEMFQADRHALFHVCRVIELDLNTQAEEYTMSSVPVMIQIKIHDRRALVNPFSDGFSLEGGMQYTAYVSMVN
ncbi:uncharacterized protein TNIN_84371 [Trichonephila inaurata madagascariensis]|uniref:Uncharacterized protein n=1 Tax=Trichonephila inaurata madagascariensis TaxID=2747483 RepID=A0A8X7C181_9ARAC|nr:uncharacterized protein TNIN_84371 [Trichonephila inaurata madagascariensis]